MEVYLFYGLIAIRLKQVYLVVKSLKKVCVVFVSPARHTGALRGILAQTKREVDLLLHQYSIKFHSFLLLCCEKRQGYFTER